MSEKKSGYATSADGSLVYWEAYIVEGERPNVLLVHGIGGDLDAWQFVREQLTAAGYSCLALDLRGHGYSGHPRAARAYELDRFFEDLLAVLAEQRLEKVVMVGHSGGAQLSMLFAAAHPEKVARLVVINGSPTGPGYLQSSLMCALSSFAVSVGSAISPPWPGPWHSPYPPGKFHKEVEWYGLTRTILRNSLASYLQSCRSYVLRDVKDEVPHILAPTCIIGSGSDGIYPPPASQELNRLIPNSTLTMIPDANHVLILNRPNEVAERILGFLSITKGYVSGTSNSLQTEITG